MTFLVYLIACLFCFFLGLMKFVVLDWLHDRHVKRHQ